MTTRIVCTFCHRISDDNIEWAEPDPQHEPRGDNFRYGICIDCSKHRFPNFYIQPRRKEEG